VVGAASGEIIEIASGIAVEQQMRSDESARRARVSERKIHEEFAEKIGALPPDTADIPQVIADVVAHYLSKEDFDPVAAIFEGHPQHRAKVYQAVAKVIEQQVSDPRGVWDFPRHGMHSR